MSSGIEIKLEMDFSTDISDPSDFTLFSEDPLEKKRLETDDLKETTPNNVEATVLSSSTSQEIVKQNNGKGDFQKEINQITSNQQVHSHVPLVKTEPYTVENPLLTQEILQLQQATQLPQNLSLLNSSGFWPGVSGVNPVVGMNASLQLLHMNNYYMLPQINTTDQIMIPQETQTNILNSSIPDALIIGETIKPMRSFLRDIIKCRHCTLYPPNAGASLPLVSRRPSNCRTVWVGGLPKNTTELIIRDIFERFGEFYELRKKAVAFCHICYKKEDSVDRALELSGYRLVIGDGATPDDSGLIFVDYSQSRHDVLDRELSQRSATRGKESPPVPPIKYCTEIEINNVLEKMRDKDDPDLNEALQLVTTWFNKGQCNKNNANHFYTVIQNAISHGKRLKQEKSDLQATVQKCKQEAKSVLNEITAQINEIKDFFGAACQQKVRDHFTKVQRKNIETWRTELLDGQSGSDDDMDISDDEPSITKMKLDDGLKEENEKLTCEIHAYKNEVSVLNSTHKAEMDECNKRFGQLTNLLKTAKDQLMDLKIKLSNAEGKLQILEQLNTDLEEKAVKGPNRQTKKKLEKLQSEIISLKAAKNREISQLRYLNHELEERLKQTSNDKNEKCSKLEKLVEKKTIEVNDLKLAKEKLLKEKTSLEDKVNDLLLAKENLLKEKTLEDKETSDTSALKSNGDLKLTSDPSLATSIPTEITPGPATPAFCGPAESSLAISRRKKSWDLLDCLQSQTSQDYWTPELLRKAQFLRKRSMPPGRWSRVYILDREGQRKKLMIPPNNYFEDKETPNTLALKTESDLDWEGQKKKLKISPETALEDKETPDTSVLNTEPDLDRERQRKRLHIPPETSLEDKDTPDTSVLNTERVLDWEGQRKKLKILPETALEDKETPGTSALNTEPDLDGEGRGKKQTISPETSWEHKRTPDTSALKTEPDLDGEGQRKKLKIPSETSLEDKETPDTSALKSNRDLKLTADPSLATCIPTEITPGSATPAFCGPAESSLAISRRKRSWDLLDCLQSQTSQDPWTPELLRKAQFLRQKRNMSPGRWCREFILDKEGRRIKLMIPPENYFEDKDTPDPPALKSEPDLDEEGRGKKLAILPETSLEDKETPDTLVLKTEPDLNGEGRRKKLKIPSETFLKDKETPDTSTLKTEPDLDGEGRRKKLTIPPETSSEDKEMPDTSPLKTEPDLDGEGLRKKLNIPPETSLEHKKTPDTSALKTEPDLDGEGQRKKLNIPSETCLQDKETPDTLALKTEPDLDVEGRKKKLNIPTQTSLEDKETPDISALNTEPDLDREGQRKKLNIPSETSLEDKETPDNLALKTDRDVDGEERRKKLNIPPETSLEDKEMPDTSTLKTDRDLQLTLYPPNGVSIPAETTPAFCGPSDSTPIETPADSRKERTWELLDCLQSQTSPDPWTPELVRKAQFLRPWNTPRDKWCRIRVLDREGRRKKLDIPPEISLEDKDTPDTSALKTEPNLDGEGRRKKLQLPPETSLKDDKEEPDTSVLNKEPDLDGEGQRKKLKIPSETSLEDKETLNTSALNTEHDLDGEGRSKKLTIPPKTAWEDKKTPDTSALKTEPGLDGEEQRKTLNIPSETFLEDKETPNTSALKTESDLDGEGRRKKLTISHETSLEDKETPVTSALNTEPDLDEEGRRKKLKISPKTSLEDKDTPNTSALKTESDLNGEERRKKLTISHETSLEDKETPGTSALKIEPNLDGEGRRKKLKIPPETSLEDKEEPDTSALDTEPGLEGEGRRKKLTIPPDTSLEDKETPDTSSLKSEPDLDGERRRKKPNIPPETSLEDKETPDTSALNTEPDLDGEERRKKVNIPPETSLEDKETPDTSALKTEPDLDGEGRGKKLNIPRDTSLKDKETPDTSSLKSEPDLDGERRRKKPNIPPETSLQDKEARRLGLKDRTRRRLRGAKKEAKNTPDTFLKLKEMPDTSALKTEPGLDGERRGKKLKIPRETSLKDKETPDTSSLKSEPDLDGERRRKKPNIPPETSLEDKEARLLGLKDRTRRRLRGAKKEAKNIPDTFLKLKETPDTSALKTEPDLDGEGRGKKLKKPRKTVLKDKEALDTSSLKSEPDLDGERRKKKPNIPPETSLEGKETRHLGLKGRTRRRLRGAKKEAKDTR